MDAILDILWFKIVSGVQLAKVGMDYIFSPLNTLGPAFAILIIAALTVLTTKYLSRKFQTRRYLALRKEFKHWHGVRQEALKYEDAEKAKLLAKNIDQAKLNRVYYDYFFEGLMKNLVTTYLPILTLLAYVNETYQADNLAALFGREYIFKFGGSDGNPVLIGAAFWFVVSIVLVHLVWFLAKLIFKRYSPVSKRTAALSPAPLS